MEGRASVGALIFTLFIIFLILAMLGVEPFYDPSSNPAPTIQSVR